MVLVSGPLIGSPEKAIIALSLRFSRGFAPRRVRKSRKVQPEGQEGEVLCLDCHRPLTEGNFDDEGWYCKDCIQRMEREAETHAAQNVHLHSLPVDRMRVVQDPEEGALIYHDQVLSPDRLTNSDALCDRLDSSKLPEQIRARAIRARADELVSEWS